MKCGSCVKKSIEKRARFGTPCLAKLPTKVKVKDEEGASHKEVDDEVEVEICKEQTKLIARQECKHVTESG